MKTFRAFAAALLVILSASVCFADVQFGRYYYDSRELSHVQWLVLGEDGDNVLLLAKDCLDCLPYNDKRTNITWENSTLRAWLNDEFFRTAFDAQEQAAIHSVSLLTSDEVIKYLPQSSQRQCSPTPYAQRRGVYMNARGLCAWWTSSPGDFGNRAHYVDDDVIGVILRT